MRKKKRNDCRIVVSVRELENGLLSSGTGVTLRSKRRLSRVKDERGVTRKRESFRHDVFQGSLR